MDLLRLGLVLFAIISVIEAQRGYNYPKPRTPFPDDRQPVTGGFASSTATGAQPASTGSSPRPFGTQQPSGGAQPRTPSSQQQFPGYPGSQQPGGPKGAEGPFGTQQISGGAQPRPFDGDQGTQQPSGGAQFRTSGGVQQPFSGFPTSQQPGAPTGTQGPFGTQQPSGGVYPGSSQQPSIGYPGSGQPGSTTDSQGPFGSQQPSGPIQPNGSKQPSAGYPGSQQPGAPTGGPGPFGIQQPSGGVQQPSISYPGSQQPGTSSGNQRSFETQQPTGKYPGGGQPGTSGGAQQPFGGYPNSEQPGAPSGIPFGTQQPSGPYPSGSQTSGTDYPGKISNGYADSEQPGAPRPSVTQQPSSGRPSGFPEEHRPENGRPVDSQRSGADQEPVSPGFGRITPLTGFPGKQGPEAGSVPTGRPEQDLNGSSRRQQGYNYLTPQIPITGGDQPTGVHPGYPRTGFGRSLGGAGPTTRPQFPSGEEKSSNGFPSSGQEVSTSQQFPSSRPSGTEQHSPSGYPQSGRPQGIIPIHTQGPQYPSNGGEFSGEGRPIGQLPFGQTDRPVLEGTPSGGVTQPSDVTGGQQSPIRPGKPETGSQFPSNGFPKTGHSERPGFPGRPTGQAINGYPTIKEQPQGSNILSGTGRPQLPPQTPGISQSRTRPQNGQRPLSSYLPPGEQGTGNLPLSEVPAPQYPSVGPSGVPSPSQFPSRGAEEPSRSQNGFGDSTKPVGEVFSGGRPSGPRTSSGFPEQATSSQNGYESSGPSGFPGQPSRPQNGYSAPGASNGKTSNGRPFGPQIPSGERQTPSRPQQGINGYPSSGSSTPQQFSRPGAPDRSTTGSSQTFPGSQQGPRGFLPNQQRSDEENGFELEDEGDYSAIPGEPGRDYPILSDVPETSFSCDAQEYRGYYADVEARCQIFHICANNKTYDFICPNGTIFHQENLVCVWWNQFDCDIAPSLYRINENIYDFSVFGAQQTGGIPAPGQDYPDLSHGPLDFQATGGDTRRPGGYSNGGPQIPTGSDEESQRPEGYPRKTPQAPTGPFSRDQEGKPQGSGSYQAPSNGVQGPGRYAFGRSQRPSEGYPTGGSQRPGNGIQRPGGYPSGPQGTIQPDTARYPNGKPEGAGEFTSGESPRTVNGVQGFRKPSTGYPSEGPEEPSNGKGYPSKRPTGQNGSQGVSTPGIDASPPGGYPGGRPQGFPLGPRDRPVGPGRQTPPKYGVPEGPIPQPQGPRASPSGSQGPSGRPSTPGFPSGPQTPVPSGPGSPFPGSPQPHTPTREYLPSL